MLGRRMRRPYRPVRRNVPSAIERGDLVDVLEHPNQERYPGQMIYVVNMDQYLYLVPFATAGDGTRFLKTIIPSRKADVETIRGDCHD